MESIQMRKLIVQAAVKCVSGLLLMGALLFLPAGTLRYAGAWRLLGLLFVPMLLVGAALLIKAPGLLQKRLNDRESEGAQRAVIALSALEFVACFSLAGLDFRFGWTRLPGWVTAASCALFLTAYALYAEVMRENAWLSRTVEIQENQRVVSTGLYGIVRHPMYFAVILLFWAMPLVLGSLPALLVMLPFPLLLVKRIHNEEKVLEEGLAGYREYEKKVRFRILPFIW